MRSENHRIRESLSSTDLDNEFQQISVSSGLEEKDAGSTLSWIRAVRDECSAALRKAEDSSDLISRMIEFELRSALFELLARREPERSLRQKVQGELLSHLESHLVSTILEDPSDSALLSQLQESMVHLLPALHRASEIPGSEISVEPDGPLLVVESEYRNVNPQQERGEEAIDPASADTKGEHASDPTSADDSGHAGNSVGGGSIDEQAIQLEMDALKEENQQLRKKLNDFLEEWGEGIRIDGNTVSILTRRKIIVKKNSQDQR
ncbi:MAG: hypothetical protein KDK23_03155 [Leptospiraceae bacterium]|nr:hypothetical protein [Leptospiraceae bacterium]